MCSKSIPFFNTVTKTRRHTRVFNISFQKLHSHRSRASRAPLQQLRACVIFTGQVIAIQLLSRPAADLKERSATDDTAVSVPHGAQPPDHQSSNAPRRALA